MMTATVIAAFLGASGNEALAGNKLDSTPAEQRENLAKNTEGAGFGPQSPRDLSSSEGTNDLLFAEAPSYKTMNLCNIHFHEAAEHKGGEFQTYAGDGDGHGHGTGYEYSGKLTAAERKPLKTAIGDGEHGTMQSGDTIEVHFVHTTAKITPGPTLGSCLSEAIKNPQLRVETQVMVLVNDRSAMDFNKLAEVKVIDGVHQAPNIPENTGVPIQYAGSTTGPSYNEKGSPFQVTWSVRPEVIKVDILTVGAWMEDNIFDEDHAHGVRNLVINPDLLSRI